MLGVCYDLRHAMMGDREFEYVDNGMDAINMRKLSVKTSWPSESEYWLTEAGQPALKDQYIQGALLTS